MLSKSNPIGRLIPLLAIPYTKVRPLGLPRPQTPIHSIPPLLQRQQPLPPILHHSLHEMGDMRIRNAHLLQQIPGIFKRPLPFGFVDEIEDYGGGCELGDAERAAGFGRQVVDAYVWGGYVDVLEEIGLRLLFVLEHRVGEGVE